MSTTPHKREALGAALMAWKPDMLQRAAGSVLRAAERLYLRAHGWTQTSDARWEEWLPSDAYPFDLKKQYTRRHAVNAQHAAYAQRVGVVRESLVTAIRARSA